MLFNSFDFLVFFPLVTVVYFALPHRRRWVWLLAASSWFYMAFVPVYILILGFTIVIDYFAGRAIERARGRRRRAWLIASLAANVGVLAVFKYWNFLAGNVNGLLAPLGWHESVPLLDILLPIGLSFHTFQAMSYTIEVYRGRQAAERHFGIYALYVMFYPQLVAGPIERPQNLLHQFRAVHELDGERVWSGLTRMLAGLFKKIVIADRLAIVVDQVYSAPDQYGPGALLIATWCFAIQIYCDFSGYSDIAIGAARVMGFNLMENFDRPYLATSIADFWRRWHISLSTWFRDYLYVPLGGNRAGKRLQVRNLLIVLLLSGLWHGAAWTFVAWGALHGAYLAASIATAGARGRLVAALELERFGALLAAARVFVTFNLVSFAWIFFRAESLADAWLIVRRLAEGAAGTATAVAAYPAQLPAATVATALGLIAAVWVAQWLRGARRVEARLARWPIWVRWPACYAAVMAMLVFGVFGEQSFIYFQF